MGAQNEATIKKRRIFDTYMFNELRAHIAQFVSLSDREWRRVEACFVFRQVPKRFLLVSEGDITREMYFIRSGLVRLYYLKESEEITALILPENHFTTSLDSFLRQSLSRQCLETLEASELLVISHTALEQLYEDVPKMNIFARKLFEQRIIHAQQILSSYVLDSPEARYLRLVAMQPSLVQRVPQHILASFLGITPVSLSRIRKRISLQ
jgi:CRP-like cAMP-binding protein